MSKKEEVPEGVLQALKHIGEHSTRNNAKTPTRVSKRSDYFKYMKDCGIPGSQVRAVEEANSALVDATIRATADDLVADIAAAKKAGNDPNDLVAQSKIPTASGQVHATVKALRKSRNPSNGADITANGATSVRILVGGAIKRDPASYARDVVTAAMK